jgi:hypothetical protein
MANEIVKANDMPDIDELKRLGIMLATSGYFEANAKADVAVAQMCVKVLAGRELGFGPFASVNGIHVIKGKPAVSANLMAAAVKGNPRYDYRVRQMDNDAVSLEFFEFVDGKRESLGLSTFTKQDAAKAGTQNMDKFGRNMMFARAMSNGVKWFCPDVFDGNAVYVPEELGATVDGDGNVIDVDYRSVDKATGEVLSTTTPQSTPNGNGNMPPVTVVTAHSDNPFDDEAPATPRIERNVATEKQHKMLFALGKQLYGDNWDTKRPELVKAVTGGRSESASDLTVKEMSTLLDGLKKRADDKAAIADVTLANVPEMAH